MRGTDPRKEEREVAPDAQTAWFLYLLIPIALAFYLILPHASPPETVAGPPVYRSDYLVFGGMDRAGNWIVVPIDLNRTSDGSGEIDYEYKLWIGRPDSFEMPLFERWRARGLPAATPARAGLQPVLREDGGYSVHYSRKGLSLKLNTSGTRESFREERPGRGPVTTTFAPAWLEVNGDSVRGVVVEEDIRFTGRDSTEGPRFGTFDWISLWSPDGDAWLLSSGERSGSIAYHRAAGGALSSAKAVAVHWTRTGLDTVSSREIPERWTVSVPEWDLEAELERTSGHVGHGEAESGTPRPVFAQIGVTGTLTAGGRSRPVYGMVEHIQDGPAAGGASSRTAGRTAGGTPGGNP